MGQKTIYNGASYDETVQNIKFSFNNAGFYNLTFIKISGEIDNPDKINGVLEDVSVAFGSEIDISTEIVFKIYSPN